MDGFSSGSFFPPTLEGDIDISHCPEGKIAPPPVVYAVIEDQNDFCVVRSDDERPEASLYLDQTYSLNIFIRSEILQKNNMALFVVLKECGETKNSFQIVDDTPVVDVMPLHERIIVGDYTLIARTEILPKRFGFDDDRSHLLRCCLPYQGECTPITISLKAPRFRPDISPGRQELAFA